jgi:hypothetical protein
MVISACVQLRRLVWQPDRSQGEAGLSSAIRIVTRLYDQRCFLSLHIIFDMLCVYSLVTVAALLFSVPSHAAQCEGRAISLPLKNQRLGDGGQAYMRGVSLGIGSPEQELSCTLSA